MGKRLAGEGSFIHDQARERWLYQYYLKNENGNLIKNEKGNFIRRAISAKTQTLLIEKVNLHLEKLENEKNGKYKNITLENWVEFWLKNYVEGTVKKRTVEIYRYYLSYIFKEPIGQLKLRNILPIEYQIFFKLLKEKGGQHKQGLSLATVGGTRRYLKMALSAAVENKILESNPVSKTKIFKNADDFVQATFLEVKEVKRLLAVIDDPAYKYFYLNKNNEFSSYIKTKIESEFYIREYRVLIHLALATGCRIGELLGLTWENVNFQKKEIKIQKILAHTNSEGYYLGTPKTHYSIRCISIDKNTFRSIEEFYQYQKKIKLNEYKNQKKLVFTNAKGHFVSVKNFTDRYFRKMLMAAKIDKKITMHSLRHTHATLLLAHGANLKAVSERLGHSSAAFTLSVYTHVLEKLRDENAKIYENILKSKN